MNRLGLGTNNFRIIGSAPPPPPTERYLIQSCVDGEEYVSQQYNVGDFQENDRIYFIPNNGVPTYGRVNYVVEYEDQEIAINYLGVNTNNCIDNYLSFTSILSDNDDTIFYVDFYCNPSSNINWNDDQYEYALSYFFSLNIYYQGYNEEGDFVTNFLNITDNIGLSPYNFIAGELNSIYQYQENTGDFITYITIDGGYEQPSFESTASFIEDDGCSGKYFLRNSGYAFFATYRTNC